MCERERGSVYTCVSERMGREAECVCVRKRCVCVCV